MLLVLRKKSRRGIPTARAGGCSRVDLSVVRVVSQRCACGSSTSRSKTAFCFSPANRFGVRGHLPASFQIRCVAPCQIAFLACVWDFPRTLSFVAACDFSLARFVRTQDFFPSLAMRRGDFFQRLQSVQVVRVSWCVCMGQNRACIRLHLRD